MENLKKRRLKNKKQKGTVQLAVPFLHLDAFLLQLTQTPLAKKAKRNILLSNKAEKEEKKMEEIMKVSHLKKYFKDVKAVDDISFSVEQGEMFGFLGVNGAGKSTTINMLCTLFPPTEGEVMINGLTLGHDNEKIKHHIGVVYQNNCLDKLLTVKENLLIRGSLYEKDARKLQKNLSHVSEILALSDEIGRAHV